MCACHAKSLKYNDDIATWVYHNMGSADLTIGAKNAYKYIMIAHKH
jgi:hypothetical protein